MARKNALLDVLGDAYVRGMARNVNALAEIAGKPFPDPRVYARGAEFVPGVGDAVGLGQDVRGYIQNPNSLTPLSGLLSLAAMAPGVPRVPKKLYRGVGAGGKSLGTAQLGKGLYSSTSKEFARQYAVDPKTKKMIGTVLEMDPAQAFPKNPLVLPGYGRGGANGIFNEWLLEQSGEKNIRDFYAKWPDPAEFVKAKGYDGVWIGEEIVKY